MEQINREMRIVVHKAGPDLNGRIVTLRQEFSTETGNLIGCMPGDERLRYRPDLFAEFQHRLDGVRTRLTSHQARWSLHAINTQRDDYVHSAEAVHSSIADYLDWAKGALSSH
ncbi:hypothetical protein SZ64_12340 [Erythrobacter sp. SG61-1L]|nr:hypothetical protein SZ64_12340 [Erythrobacter sp. SG61-1L]